MLYDRQEVNVRVETLFVTPRRELVETVDGDQHLASFSKLLTGH